MLIFRHSLNEWALSSSTIMRQAKAHLFRHFRSSLLTVRNVNLKVAFFRYVRFCTVGGSGVFVDMAALALFTSSYLGLHLAISKVLAAEIALVNNFVWNELWTFRSQTQQTSRLRRFAAFHLVCATGILISVALLTLQVHFLHANVFVANFISIVLVSLWNFAISARFAWRTTGQRFPDTQTSMSSSTVKSCVSGQKVC